LNIVSQETDLEIRTLISLCSFTIDFDQSEM
jgi:hypothetical protein